MDKVLVSDVRAQQKAYPTQEWQPLVVAGCSLAIIAALVLGVGIGSHLVLRHIVQTLPLWVAVILGLRHSAASGWAALPSFLFWSILMAAIWLYLLGVSTILSGHFTGLEIRNDGGGGNSIGSGNGDIFRSQVIPLRLEHHRRLHGSRSGSSRLLPS